MERRVLRKDNKYYVELPPDFSEQENVEFFQLRDGYYLLCMPLSNYGKKLPNSASSPASYSLTEDEKTLLHKLLSVKFDQRIPPKVDKLLNEKERQLLKMLLSKDYVNIFKSKKYPQGVYNINDRIYPLLSAKSPSVQKSPAKEIPSISSAKPTVPTATLPSRPAISTLSSPFSLDQGYAVIDDARIAAQFSEQLRKQGRSNSVLGVKGFDGKFYAVTKTYFAKVAPLILKSLEEPKDIESLSKACKVPSAACLAILRLLSEQGDVVEKRKGVFLSIA